MIEFEFVLKEQPDPQWLTSVLFASVAHDIRFNEGRFSGTYRIIPEDPAEKIAYTASDDIDRTELLADAINHYGNFCPKNTEFYLMTTYTASQPELPVWLSITPHKRKHLFSIGTNKSDLEGSEHFTSFLTLPKAIFERFSFVYGASRVDEQCHVPMTQADTPSDDSRLAMFYPPAMVKSIGKEKLLAAPAARTTTLADGSMFVLVTDNLDGNQEKYNTIREHLSG